MCSSDLLGVSVEDQATAEKRIPWLLDSPAAVRFVSYEPALGPVDFTNLDVMQHWDLPYHKHAPTIRLDALRGHWKGPDDIITGLDWVIVGGESGPGARPFGIAWARSVVEQCREAGVACFVKQLGAHPYPSATLRDPKGGDPSEWPEDLRVREWPRASR